MRSRYQRWMHEWETRLTTRDTNRVVRPLEWGLEWVERWPVVNGNFAEAAADPERYLRELSDRIVVHSDEFFSYRTPRDFELEHRIPARPPGHKAKKDAEQPATFLRFTSAVDTPYAENNRMNARWFPAKENGQGSSSSDPTVSQTRDKGEARTSRQRRGKRAVVVVPQWNADAESHNGLCRIFNWMGISALRMSMPYHDVRMPAELQRADYAVSSNIGRTIDATRQAIVDIRSCLDWLEQQGYTELGVMGTSLGSCYAFITAAHDERVKVAAYNHASTFFGDVVWTGQSTRHIRAGLEEVLTQDRLRDLWRCISPMSYFDKYERTKRKSLIIYATYDLTFLPEFSRIIVGEFERRRLDAQFKILPCGHYTTGETPYKYLDAFHIARFMKRAF
jgi:dienelactone hydrolase